MQLDELLDDREAEPEPAVPASSSVGLAEALEDVRQELRRDALARCR